MLPVIHRDAFHILGIVFPHPEKADAYGNEEEEEYP